VHTCQRNACCRCRGSGVVVGFWWFSGMDPAPGWHRVRIGFQIDHCRNSPFDRMACTPVKTGHSGVGFRRFAALDDPVSSEIPLACDGVVRADL
jgi:hypothetical protein